MTKKIMKEIANTARKIAEQYNPYREKATKYYIDNEPMYIWAGTHYTETEILEAYIETAIKDMTRGYEERMVGYYDKWYRYSHADEGRAYDMGQQFATENPKCAENCIIY